MCALIADFAELTDFMCESGCVDAGQFYLVGKTFLKIVAAETSVFVKLLTHLTK